eukprot:6185693-Pleurochrysis_carterae.AAC.1
MVPFRAVEDAFASSSNVSLPHDGVWASVAVLRSACAGSSSSALSAKCAVRERTVKAGVLADTAGAAATPSASSEIGGFASGAVCRLASDTFDVGAACTAASGAAAASMGLRLCTTFADRDASAGKADAPPISATGAPAACMPSRCCSFCPFVSRCAEFATIASAVPLPAFAVLPNGGAW